MDRFFTDNLSLCLLYVCIAQQPSLLSQFNLQIYDACKSFVRTTRSKIGNASLVGTFEYLVDLGTIPTKNAGKDVKPPLSPQLRTHFISRDKSLTRFFRNIEATLDHLEL